MERYDLFIEDESAEDYLRDTKYTKWRRPPNRGGKKKSKMPAEEAADIDRIKTHSRAIEKDAEKARNYEKNIVSAMCGESKLTFEDGSSMNNKKIEVERPHVNKEKKADTQQFDSKIFAESLGLKFKTEDPEILKFYTSPRDVKAGGKYFLKDEYVNGVFVLSQVVLNKSILFLFRSVESGFTTTYSASSLRGLEDFRRIDS